MVFPSWLCHPVHGAAVLGVLLDEDALLNIVKGCPMFCKSPNSTVA